MNPSTSSSVEIPKPISSPRRTLPEAPPSYYDFPPSYTSNGETFTDELPAYCPTEFPGTRQCARDGSRSMSGVHNQRVFTVLPRQSYAIRMQRSRRVSPSTGHLRRRLNKVFGLAFILMLGTVILILAVLMTISLV